MSSTSWAERLKKSKEKKKQASRETSRLHRLRRSSLTNNEESKERSQFSPFPSRMAKKQTIDAVNDVIPNTPEKKASIITSLINSPQTRKILEETGVILSEEDQLQLKLFCAVVDDATSMIANEKSRAAISILQCCVANLLKPVVWHLLPQRRLELIGEE